MVSASTREPFHIEQASFSLSENGLRTFAAYLLAAGVWFRRIAGDAAILPNEDLEPLGLASWTLRDAGGFDFPIGIPEPLEGEARPDQFHLQLGRLIYEAYRSRLSRDLAIATAAGTNSPDPLVRICALVSAFEIFSVPFVERMRRLSQFDFSGDATAVTIASMLTARTLGASISAANPPVGAGMAPLGQAGLILVHGTNFPPNRPVWSVPGVGPLFAHISSIRHDVYGGQDYFRWEGGYSDYAREVGAYNLTDWLQRRQLTGIDVVAHSHGGNVLIGSTDLGSTFNKVIFLSCPVRWNQYQPSVGSIKTPLSIRIRFDFVILADRSSQRFPVGCGIPERLLPIWFGSHGATTDPAVWQSENLDVYL